MVRVSGALPWGALRKPEMQLSFRAVLHCSMRWATPKPFEKSQNQDFYTGSIGIVLVHVHILYPLCLLIRLFLCMNFKRSHCCRYVPRRGHTKSIRSDAGRTWDGACLRAPLSRSPGLIICVVVKITAPFGVR